MKGNGSTDAPGASDTSLDGPPPKAPSFTQPPKVFFPSYGTAGGVAVADFNADGLPDVITFNTATGQTAGIVTTFIADGPAVSRPARIRPGIGVDGLRDLRGVDGQYDRRRCDGQRRRKQRDESVHLGRQRSADLNGDGKPDIVVAGFEGVYLLQNSTM